MSVTTGSHRSSGGISSPFRPSPSHHRVISEAFNLHETPTYLFRLANPDIDLEEGKGRTDTSEVSSPAFNQGISVDLLNPNQDPTTAAFLLNEHLQWRCEDDCDLMSWSSSLLFVLQFGLYCHNLFGDKGSSLSGLQVLVVDTRHYPKGTFLRELDAINQFKQYEPLNQDGKTLESLYKIRTGQFYFGEYLTKGRLLVEDHFARASMADLIRFGLFDLCPGLGDESAWVEWANRVVELRQAPSLPPSEKGSDSDVQKAVTMAKTCFGRAWALPIAVMLLTLRWRERDDYHQVVGELEAEFHVTEIRSLSEQLRLDPEYNRMAESQQCRILASGIARKADKAWSLKVAKPTKDDITPDHVIQELRELGI